MLIPPYSPAQLMEFGKAEAVGVYRQLRQTLARRLLQLRESYQGEAHEDGMVAQLAALHVVPHRLDDAQRRAGVLIPLFSIRTRTGWGLGEIPDLGAMARWAASCGIRVVQMLPVSVNGFGVGGQNAVAIFRRFEP